MERGDVGALRVLRAGQRDLECEDVGLVEARVYCRQFGAPGHQTRAGQQHQRQSDLRHHQALACAHTGLADGAGPASVSQRIDESPATAERGQTAEDKAGQKRDRCRKPEHRETQTNFGSSGKLERDALEQHHHASLRDREAEDAAGEAQQRAFREEPPQDLKPTCSERMPYRDLALSRVRADEEEVCDVGASDQEHEANGAQQDPQNLAHRPDQPVLHGHRIRPHAAVRDEPLDRRIRIGAIDLVEARVQVLAQRVEGDPWAQPGDRPAVEPAEVVGVGAIAVEKELCRAETKIGRKHPDHGVGIAADDEITADHRRVRCEAPNPVTVAENDASRFVGKIIGGCEQPAMQRAEPQRFEER